MQHISDKKKKKDKIIVDSEQMCHRLFMYSLCNAADLALIHFGPFCEGVPTEDDIIIIIMFVF